MTTAPGNTIRAAKTEAESAIQQILQALTQRTGTNITGISIETCGTLGDPQDRIAAVKIDLTI